jgi:hypothetical protein
MCYIESTRDFLFERAFMKKVNYIIEASLHNNEDWYRVHSEPTLSKALKEYNRYRRNTKGNTVLAEMIAQQRIKKVTEEVLCQDNSF